MESAAKDAKQKEFSNIETVALGDYPERKASGASPRVLVFTCSSQRPFYLRCCVMQMQLQIWPVDHCVFINHPHAAKRLDFCNYISMLDDLVPPHGRLVMRYGRSGSQLYNYLEAINMADSDNYDLFIKVDDDDVYRSDYVQTVVDDYLANQWDFSGTFSQGLLDGAKWEKRARVRDIGLSEEDRRLGVASMMPSSFALSRKALNVIREIPTDQTCNEDIAWRRALHSDVSIRFHVRKQSRMAYNVHGNNISSHDSLGKLL